jgi:membrane protease YdiL (CAAX protease family)
MVVMIRDALAILFASFFPLGMSLVYFLVVGDTASGADPRFMTAFFGGKLIQFLFPIAYIWWFDRTQIRFVAATGRGMPLAIGFALAVSVAMYLLYFLVVQDIPTVREETPAKIHAKVQQFGADSPLAFIVMALLISCGHSLLEEYYWRWFVYKRMRLYLSMWVSIVLSSIGFTLHHVVILGVFFPENFWLLALPFSICVGVGGGVWAWIYERSGSLVAAWLSHCLIDAAIMGIGYVMLIQYW